MFWLFALVSSATGGQPGDSGGREERTDLVEGGLDDVQEARLDLIRLAKWLPDEILGLERAVLAQGDVAASCERGHGRGNVRGGSDFYVLVHARREAQEHVVLVPDPVPS